MAPITGKTMPDRDAGQSLGQLTVAGWAGAFGVPRSRPVVCAVGGPVRKRQKGNPGSTGWHPLDFASNYLTEKKLCDENHNIRN
jgi:hypothetical protein